MAKIWRVKSGAGANRTDQGTSATVEELAVKLEKYPVLFLSEKLPKLNPENQGDYYRHVVIEVLEGDDFNVTFDKIGFYVVKDVDPEQVGFLFN